jgi:hypothetical protein
MNKNKRTVTARSTDDTDLKTPLQPNLALLRAVALLFAVLLLPALLLGLSGCASPNTSERTARAGEGEMHQDIYRSQIEGF